MWVLKSYNQQFAGSENFSGRHKKTSRADCLCGFMKIRLQNPLQSLCYPP